MKKKLMIALMGAGLLAGTLAGPAMAEHTSQNACFGQARAENASDPDFRPIGKNFFSVRKGDNAQMNRDFREACQGD